MSGSLTRVTDSLRWALVVLVAANLGFVALTEAAQWTWLAPLLVLTLLAPYLLPLSRFFAYRAVWNLGVIGVFALLVHHVTSAGIDRLLEDGLLLAALCQVHLINNLSHEQKPDLLFFNSFLIAVMTSFLSFDVPYCVLLIVYAPTLVVALELLVLSRMEPSTQIGRGIIARVVFGGIGRGVVILAIAICTFVVLPRDFRRRGLIGDWAKQAGGSFSRVDFSDRIEHRETRGVAGDGRVVATLRLLDGTATAVPEYWRGQTLDRFDGRTWRERSPSVVDRPWRRNGRNQFIRTRARPVVARVAVRIHGPVATPLFVPLAAEKLRVLSRERWRRVGTRTDLTVRHVRRLEHRLAYLYEVEVGAGGPKRRSRRPAAAARRTHLALPKALPVSVLQLANQLTGRENEPVARHVARVCGHLAAEYEYLAPGVPGGAGSLDDFLSGEASGGHCELFASAAAAILRLQRVPCRIVTGYRLPPWPAGTKNVTIRSSDAHAWIEAYDENNGGWITADPTPAAADSAAGRNESWWGAATAAVEQAWKHVTGFDAEARAGTQAWFGAFFAGMWRELRRPPVGITCILVLGGLLWFRRRRDPRPPAVQRYHRALAKAGMRRLAGETPRELVARARVAGGRHIEALAAATAVHERERYGPRIRSESPTTFV